MPIFQSLDFIHVRFVMHLLHNETDKQTCLVVSDFCDEHPESVDAHSVAPAPGSFTRLLGSTASLSCEMGYVIVPVGSLTATCSQHDGNKGKWMASSKCQGNAQLFLRFSLWYNIFFHIRKHKISLVSSHDI